MGCFCKLVIGQSSYFYGGFILCNLSSKVELRIEQKAKSVLEAKFFGLFDATNVVENV